MASVTLTAGSCSNDATVGTLDWKGYIPPSTYTGLVGTEVSADDDTFAEVDPVASGVCKYLKCVGFGGAIPTGATVNGFEVIVKYLRGGSSFTVSSTAVKMVKAGSIVGNDIGDAPTTDWPTTETSKTWGSSTELAGVSWTVSDVNNANFGVVISPTYSAGKVATAPGVQIDIVQIKVYYTPATAKSGGFMLTGMGVG